VHLSRFQHPSVEELLRVHDPARGERIVTRDSAGRISHVRLADGIEIDIERDPAGVLRSVHASDGTFVEARRKRQGLWRIAANDYSVDAIFRPDVCTLTTSAGELSWERDHLGRLTRVQLPGAAAALTYQPSHDGSVRIGWENGTQLLRVTSNRSVEWAKGIWRGEASRSDFRWSIEDSAGRVRAGLVAECDLLRRPIRREWSHGAVEIFRRDDRGRLTYWERTGPAAASMAFDYDSRGCVGRRSGSTQEHRILDDAGRVLRAGFDRTYSYDLNGRRVRFASSEACWNYGYDALGQLRAAACEGWRQSYRYDGLGRRCAVDANGEIRFEHRDPQGRLWCVTNESGELRYAFIWLDDRPLARLEEGAIAEVFLCDEQATLLGTCASDDDRLVVTPANQPPFGAVTHFARPTLHGHFGDPRTGLICFGAREYDPATASFLIPDQFHGEADDPRRWAGATDAELRAAMEAPADRIHPYAVAQFDPVGHADRDGHVMAGNVIVWILNTALSLSWGWPFTAVSGFFFLPFDLYFELIGRILQIFRLIFSHGVDRRAPGYSTFPWPNHSIFGSRLFSGSSRQRQLTFSYNGFMPRVISGGGIDGDRATTIGQVIWIRQGELDALARPRVVKAYDIEGGGALTAFNQDPAKHSILAITCTDAKGKQYIHGSHWSRGPGNTIVPRGAAETFGDLADGSGHKPFYLHLAKPIPLDAPVPTSSSDKEKLSIAEYVFDPAPAAAAKTSTVQIDNSVAFAIRMKANPKVNPKDWLQLSFPGDLPIDPVYVLVALVDTDSESIFGHYTMILYQGFPTRVITPPAPPGGGAAPAAPPLKDLEARRIIADTTRPAIDGWVLDGANTALRKPDVAGAAPLDVPDLHKNDLLLIIATTPAAVLPALTSDPPPANDTTGASIKKIISSVKLATVLDAANAFTTAEVRILRLAGKRVGGSVEASASPEQIKFAGDGPDAEKDQYVAVTLGAGGDPAYAIVTDLTDRVLKLQWLAAPLVIPADKTPVFVQRLDVSKEDDEKASSKAPAGDAIDLQVPRAKAFAANAILLFKENANQQIRILKEVTKVRIELSDDVVGTVAFKVQPAKIDSKFSSIDSIERATLNRFLKQTAGSAPSTYQSFPQSIISIVIDGFGYLPPTPPPPRSDAVLHEFYARSDSADLKDYPLRWRPFSYNGSDYFLLTRDLPLYVEDGVSNWYLDRDEPRKVQIIPPPTNFTIYEYTATNARREDDGDRRILGTEAEALVPEEPVYHFTLHDSLLEHETHHTVQSARYGPFMGALPLWSMLQDTADFVALGKKDNPPKWVQAAVPSSGGGNQGITWYQIASIGGIMTLAWKYLLLLPFYASPKLRDEILKLDYNDLMKVMSPIWSATIEEWPRPNNSASPVDPANPYSRDAGQVIAEFLLRAMDLRSWVPFLGMIPTWLGDGPRNFVEQQASRASGDLYSTILSANDEFNRDTRSFLGLFGRGSQDANLTLPIGNVVRMMAFAGDRYDRLFLNEGADRTGWALNYQSTFRIDPAVTVKIVAGGIVHPGLYQPTGAAPPTIPIEGPDGTVLNFDSYPANGEFSPRLRALVPVPPQVARATGFYFAAVTPSVYHMESFDAEAALPETNAKTAVVDLTFNNGKVNLGKEKVPWAAPVAPAGGAAAAGTSVTLKRFYTETVDLKIEDQDLQLFQIKDSGPAGLITRTDTKTGINIKISGAPAAAPAAPAQTRIRIYRVLKKNDADPKKNDPSFELYYGKNVTELKDVRSFLDKDLWFPFRDFMLEVDSLPLLAAINMKSSETKTVSLALALERQEKFTIRLDMPAGAPRPLPVAAPVPNLNKKKIGPSTTVSPSGEDWQIGPLDGLIEETATYKLEVEYGPAGRSAAVSCAVTVEPVIRVTGPAPLLAKKGSPLTLNVAGAADGFSVSMAPSLQKVEAKAVGATAVVTVADEGPNIAEQDVVVTVDDGHNKGRRTIRVSRP
jgi:hypothetical protein